MSVRLRKDITIGEAHGGIVVNVPDVTYEYATIQVGASAPVLVAHDPEVRVNGFPVTDACELAPGDEIRIREFVVEVGRLPDRTVSNLLLTRSGITRSGITRSGVTRARLPVTGPLRVDPRGSRAAPPDAAIGEPDRAPGWRVPAAVAVGLLVGIVGTVIVVSGLDDDPAVLAVGNTPAPVTADTRIEVMDADPSDAPKLQAVRGRGSIERADAPGPIPADPPDDAKRTQLESSAPVEVAQAVSAATENPTPAAEVELDTRLDPVATPPEKRPPQPQPRADATQQLELSQQVDVAAHIERARSYLDQGYVSLPRRRNAVHELQMALRIQSSNADARMLLQACAERLTSAARDALAVGLYVEAWALLTDATDAVPRYAPARQLLREGFDDWSEKIDRQAVELSERR